MKYTVYSNGDRSIIASEPDKIEPGFSPRSQPLEAKSWIAAKLAFGFELTPVQRELLAKQ